jgi:hypothetical protein
MKTTGILKTAVLAVVTATLSWSSPANEPTRCDAVFEEVRAAVESDPAKILVIIEDAMVAHENCACEIVKAAIQASNADPELKRQIVLTATHIAPKLGPLVAACAGVNPADSGVAILDQETGVPMDGALSLEEGEDYSLLPDDIRGLYLIQPVNGGFTTSAPPAEEAGGSTTVVSKRIPPKRSVAQSPSVALGP